MDLNKASWETPRSVKEHDDTRLRYSEIELLKTHFSKPGKILDLGCGSGRTSIHLHGRGFNVDAIDYSEAMIAKARQEYPKIRFRVMNAAQLDFPNDHFDYALFSFNGLDYLFPGEQRTKALREIRRVLKPGGLFAFSSHNARFIPNSLGRWGGFIRSIIRGYVRPYRLELHSFGPLVTYYISPKKEFEELRRAGFEPIDLISKFSKEFGEIAKRDPYPMYVCRKS